MKTGPLQIRRTWNLPHDLRKSLEEYTGSRTGKLFVQRDGSEITKEQAEKALKACGVEESFLRILMKRYYDQTGDP